MCGLITRDNVLLHDIVICHSTLIGDPGTDAFNVLAHELTHVANDKGTEDLIKDIAHTP